MLATLKIKNFIFVDDLEIDFQNGLNIFTGETGSGKSMIFGAMALLFGQSCPKNSAKMAPQCEITGLFNLENYPSICEFLKTKDIDDAELIIKRVVKNNLTSRYYVNDHLVSLALIKELAPKLCRFHGQHDQHYLLQKERQLFLLDNFAAKEIKPIKSEVLTIFNEWQNAKKQITQLLADQQNPNEVAFLKFQIKEIDDLNLGENEVENLKNDYKKSLDTTSVLADFSQTLNLLNGIDLNNAISLLKKHEAYAKETQNILKSLEEGAVNLEEAQNDLNAFLEEVTFDEEKAQEIERRLDKIRTIARKNNVNDDELLLFREKLQKRLFDFEKREENLKTWEIEEKRLAKIYLEKSEKLSLLRQKAAEKLQKEIMKNLSQLKMNDARFFIKVEKKEVFKATGLDEVTFLISTNVGSDFGELNQIVSGGELSRISLAIEVAGSFNNDIPILVFDEVDSGVGGAVASILGELLHKLSRKAQIFCITHLPQVAARGDLNFAIAKYVESNCTKIQVTRLDEKEKIKEIARMLGGLEITNQALAHAAELCKITGNC